MSHHTKDFVDVPGGYLYYEQRGHGPDVVLLNGGWPICGCGMRPSSGWPGGPG